MKKKMISLLLTAVMMVSLVCAITVSAYAEPTVTFVTVAQGDTVVGICKKYGVDYYSYKNLIMALNGVSSESDFSKIKIGSNFAIPISDAAAKALANCSASVTITPSNSQTAGSTATSKTPGMATAILSGDGIGYYIVEHTVQSGDTINSIYKGWGIGYKTYTNQILELNKLSGFNKIAAGKQLLLPTTVAGNSADVRYTVMKHTMKSGETVYNVVTTGYGLDFNTNQELLKLVNGKDNLAAFKAGEALYIPVSGVVNITAGQTAAK